MIEDLPADDDPLASPPPALDEAEAEAVAARHFGRIGRARRLSSERDANFRIDTAEGAFVLKVANAAEPEAETRLQGEALLHVARRDPALPAPRLVPTLAGEALVPLPGLGIARCVTWLEGEPLHLLAPHPDRRAAVARLSARLGAALADFRHPAAGRPLLWDVARAARLRPMLAVADRDLARLAGAALDRFEAAVAPALPGLRRQVAHNDFNPHNLLADPADPGRVAGVIDFGDIVETPLACDVAVAASYQIFPDEHPADALAAFAAAYHAVRPLTETELALLPDLVAARMVATVAIAGWRAARYPDNRDYILRNMPRARAGLVRLAATDRAAAAERILRACGEGPPR